MYLPVVCLFVLIACIKYHHEAKDRGPCPEFVLFHSYITPISKYAKKLVTFI